MLSAYQFMLGGNDLEYIHPVEGEVEDAVRSYIIPPFGEALAGPGFGKEAILTVELNKNEIIRGKYDFEVTGYYSRPDILTLNENE